MVSAEQCCKRNSNVMSGAEQFLDFDLRTECTSNVNVDRQRKPDVFACRTYHAPAKDHVTCWGARDGDYNHAWCSWTAKSDAIAADFRVDVSDGNVRFQRSETTP